MTKYGGPPGCTTQRAAERRQNLAQGKASKASETLGYVAKKDRARFGGRQSLAVAFLLSIGLFLSCHRDNRGGINAGTGGWPSSSSSSPIEVSSSAQVVKVTTTPVEIAVNGSAEAIVKLSISPGYHINANPATYSYLIATAVEHTVDPDEGLPIVGKTVYPQAILKKFAFAEAPLAVYEGEIVITMALRSPRPGECYICYKKGANLTMPITARVQACDNEKCYPPAKLDATIPITVN